MGVTENRIKRLMNGGGSDSNELGELKNEIAKLSEKINTQAREIGVLHSELEKANSKIDETTAFVIDFSDGVNKKFAECSQPKEVIPPEKPVSEG